LSFFASAYSAFDKPAQHRHIKGMVRKTPKRPRDPSQLAKAIIDLATGEAEDVDPDAGKSKAAQELGRKGGKARAERLSKKRRAEIAKRAARARWGH